MKKQVHILYKMDKVTKNPLSGRIFLFDSKVHIISTALNEVEMLSSKHQILWT
jgi:hypothetical protein